MSHFVGLVIVPKNDVSLNPDYPKSGDEVGDDFTSMPQYVSAFKSPLAEEILAPYCDQDEEYCIEYVVAKKGDEGITVVGEDNFVKHIKPHTVENPDVTGAGDTVIAALSIAYAKTNDIEFITNCAIECGGPILEMASGTGRLAEPLVKRGLDYTGISP